MIRTVHAFIFLFGLLCLIPTSKAQQTVEDYTLLALENNPQLKAKFNAYYEELEKTAQAGTLPDPDIALGAYILPVETRVGSRVFDVRISQRFPWFGTLSAQKKESSQWAQVQYQRFQAHKTELLFSVKSVYYQLYFIRKSIAIQNDYLHLLQLQENNHLARVKAAQSSLVDVLRVQMEQKVIETKLEELNDDVVSLTAEMNRLLNRASNIEVQTTPQLVLNTILQNEEILFDSILSNSPDLKAWEATSKALQFQKDLAHKDGLPSFSASVSYGAINKRSDINIANNGQDILVPSIALNIPINRKKYRAKSKAVDFKLMQTSLETKAQQNRLKTDLVTAIISYKKAVRKTRLYSELTQQAQQTLDLVTTAYSASTKDYDNVLQVQQQLLEYQLASEAAKIKQNIAVAHIEKLMAKGI